MTTTTNNTRNVTDEMKDACSRWIDEQTGKVFYLVASQSEPGTYYKVEFNTQYKVLQCLSHNGRQCPAASEGKHCWHLDAALASEQEYKVECRVNRDADTQEAMASRCDEEITEQALVQHYVGQGVDLATAERIVYAKGPQYNEQDIKQAQYLNQRAPFSLLK